MLSISDLARPKECFIVSGERKSVSVVGGKEVHGRMGPSKGDIRLKMGLRGRWNIGYGVSLVNIDNSPRVSDRSTTPISMLRSEKAYNLHVSLMIISSSIHT